MILSIVFVAIAVLLCFTALLAILGITHFYMRGPDPIERDGLARGALAPVWRLSDSSGVPRSSPPRAAMQLVVFADNSLKSFPSVVEGLRELAQSAPELEILVLLRRPNARAEPILAVLGLGALPVVTGSESLYGRYNVRVMPFLIFVDSAGLARASSLVNEAWQVTTLYRIAALPPDPVGRTFRIAPWRRPSGQLTRA